MNIDVLWKMSSDIDKCEVIAFNKGPLAHPGYARGGIFLKCVQENRYFGVEVQSNLNFENHITS